MSAPPKTFKESVLELNRNAKTWEEVEQFIITSAKGMKKSVKVLMGRFENWLKETGETKAPHEIEGPPLVEELEEITSPIPEEKVREVAETHKENNLDAPSGCFPHTGKMPKIKISNMSKACKAWEKEANKRLNGKCLCGCDCKPEDGNLFYRGHGRKLKMLYLKFLKSQKELHSLPLETQDYLKTRWSGLTV